MAPENARWLNDCADKTWYIHTMEYYSVIKRNKVQINIFKSPDET
jgi:hypothetical protein